MKLSSITQSNYSSILKWAVKNNANFKKDLGLTDIISDDMKYLLTFDDVNFLELYRLSEIYRDRLIIIKMNSIIVPSDTYFEEHFEGQSETNKELVKYSEMAKLGIRKYIDLLKQVDANRENNVFSNPLDVLFVPMVCRRFSVQIPLRFIDLIFAISETEMSSVFNYTYPDSLENLIDSGGMGFETKLMVKMIKTIGIAPYEPKTTKYLDITKFNPLQKKTEEQNFYDPVLLSFWKINPVTAQEIKFNFFKTNKDELERVLKKLKKIDSPMELEFAIQLPIEYMQIIQKSYSNQLIDISYRSSFEVVASKGFNYEKICQLRDYETNEISETPVELYSVRLHEAALQNTLAVSNLAKAAYSETGNVISLIDVFSLLPSVYTTQAVIKINSQNLKKLMSETNPFVKSIFTKIQQQFNLLKNDMDKL